MDKYILRPKTDNSITFSIRVKKDIIKDFDTLSEKSSRSRNELINLAMQYFLDTVELENESEK